MDEKHYGYNARWSLIIGGGGFFAVGALVLRDKALTNDRGAIIEYFIRLDQRGATAFYWSLTACGVLFVIAALGMAIRRVISPRVLSIDSTGLSIPHGFFQTKQSRVEFSEILSLSELKVRRQLSLRLRTDRKTYCITESLLPSRRDYDDIKSAIVSRVPNLIGKST